MQHKLVRIAIGVPEGFIALSAIGGGIALLLGIYKDGVLIEAGGQARFPLEWLQHTPFSDYTIPALILAIGVGGSSLIGAVMVFTGRKIGVLASVAAGLIMAGYIVVEVVMLRQGVSWIEGLYFGLGLAISGLAAYLWIIESRHCHFQSRHISHASGGSFMSQVTPTEQQAIPAPRGARNSATRIVASAIGVYGGLLGMEHGIGETLQGNVAPGGVLINAIGPQAKDVWQGREPALTLIPNFFVTGVLAIIVSLIVLVWAAAYVRRKQGGLVLMLLSILQFLVGGGLAPIPMIIIAGAVATRIHAPLTWWRTHLSAHSRRLLATWRPWSLIAFFVLGSVDLAIAIFGNNPNLVNALGPFLMGLLLLTIIAAFAHDIKRQSDSHKEGLGEEKLCYARVAHMADSTDHKPLAPACFVAETLERLIRPERHMRYNE